MSCCEQSTDGSSGGGLGAACEVVIPAQLAAIDSGAVINAAITTLNTLGGGTICLAPGTYVLDTSVQPRSNVSIKGAGPATILIWRNGHVGTNIDTDRSLIAFPEGTNRQNIDIYNLALDGNQANVVTCHHAVRLDTCQYVRLRALTIRNTQLDGIHIIDIAASGRLREVEISECFVDSAQRSSFALISGEHVTIGDCISRNPVNTHFDFEPDIAAQVIEDVVVHDCVGEDTASLYIMGMSGNGLGTVQDVVFADNVFISAGHFGSLGNGVIQRIKICDNEVRCRFGFGGVGDLGSLYVIAGASDIEIANNRIEVTAWNAAGAAVRLNSASGRVTMIGNTVIGDPTAGPRYALRVGGAAGRVTIADNVFLGPVLLGDDTVGTNGVLFEGNTVDLNGTTTFMALDLQFCSRVSIIGNRILGGDYGIIVADSGALPTLDVQVIDNVLLDWRRRCMDWLNGTNGTVVRVEVRGNHCYSASATSVFGIVLQERMICTDNYVEMVGAGGAGTAGIAGATDTVVRGNTVRHGNSANSFIYGAGDTGYVCAENQSVIAPTIAGVPVRAANNDLIVV